MEILVGDITKPILIDECDYHLILNHKWSWIDGNVLGNIPKWYLTSVINKRTTYLHREIMNCPKGMVVDHIYGNTFDMRKVNLRITTQKENIRTRNKSTTKQLPKGVYQKKGRNRFVAKFQSGDIKKHIGTFDTVSEAEKAYKEYTP